MSKEIVLSRAMPTGGPTEWSGASWVGALQEEQLTGAASVRLDDWAGERRTRLLVRNGLRVRGFVTLAVADGLVDVAELSALVAGLPHGDDVVEPAYWPHISVVLCSRDRAELLAGALGSILAADYPSFDVVVVDNAPSTDATKELIERLDDPRVRRVLEPVPGLSRARNAGARAATGEIIAFTDDDVLVDPLWLRAVASAFALAPAVGCVSGLVPSGELRTQTQAYFDQRVTWSDAVRRSVFSQVHPPKDVLFPFKPGDFGTGANFALRRAALFQLGGFDEAFGVGTRTSGGEDLDMFLRILIGGWTLVVEPTSIIWHRHRADQAALEQQAKGYGRGLGAWLTKVATEPRTAAMAARRSVSAVRHLSKLRAGERSTSAQPDESGIPADYRQQLAELESRTVLEGPVAYLRERRAGAKARPLL